MLFYEDMIHIIHFNTENNGQKSSSLQLEKLKPYKVPITVIIIIYISLLLYLLSRVILTISYIHTRALC